MVDESDAKKILDSLARRVGFDFLEIDKVGVPSLVKHDDCLFKCLYINGCVVAMNPQMGFSRSRCLESLLEMSAEGHDVKFFDLRYAQRSPQKMHVFLPAFSTLESVLVSLDLEKTEEMK